jgi:hypothetical protein
MVPSAPAGGGFMYGGTTGGLLSWAPPTDDGGTPITTYMLSLTPDGQPTTEHQIQAPGQYYELTDLVHGIVNQATVKASNDGGNTYGPEFIFAPIVPLLPPTSPPTSAEAVLLESNAVTISWTPPETAPEGYAYYFVQSQSSNSSDPSIGFGTADITQLSCELSGFNIRSRYSFTVQVVNNVGRSPTAVTNTIVFPPPPPPPAETIEVPVETTQVPVETTQVPAETTQVPAETIEVPAETTEVPAETTEVPSEPIDTSAFEAAPMAPPITTEEPLPEDYTDAPETL